MTKNYFYSILVAGCALLPVVVMAAEPQDIGDVIGIFWSIIAAIIPVIFTLALVFFLWGAAKYIYQADDSSKRAEGSKLMLYGIIALFVMVGVWGLVGILGATFGVELFIPFFDAPAPATGGGGLIPV